MMITLDKQPLCINLDPETSSLFLMVLFVLHCTLKPAEQCINHPNTSVHLSHMLRGAVFVNGLCKYGPKLAEMIMSS